MAAALPFIAIAAMGAGTIMQANAEKKAGNAANKQAKFQATQMEQQAGQERAGAQRQSIEARRKANLAISRATALAAASGAGATDPTVMDVIGGLVSEGELAAGTARYQGEEKARGMETQASATRYEGKLAKQASRMKARATIIQGIGQMAGSSSGQSLMGKFGGGGSPTMQPYGSASLAGTTQTMGFSNAGWMN